VLCRLRRSRAIGQRLCRHRAVAVGCTVEQGVATVRCAASPRTAGALLASARDACAALDYDWARPAAASTVAELSASASAASAVAAAVTVEYSSLASVIESDNSHRTASASRFSFHSFTSGSAPRLASVKGDLGLRPRARAFSGSAPRLASVKGDLGLRPRARAVSGLRPCARAFSGSAPRLASVKGDSRMSTTPSSCRLRPCPHRRRDLRYIPDAFSIGPGGGV
jgi:hypothetical protein